MISVPELRKAAIELEYKYALPDFAAKMNEAANTILELASQIDGCVRVAADALKRAENAG